MSKNTEFTSDLYRMIRIVIFNTIGIAFLSVIIPIEARTSLYASSLEIGLLTSIRVIGSTLSPLISGVLSDRMNSKKFLILTGSIGRGIAYLLIYFGFCLPNMPLLVIGLFTLGFMGGLFWVPFDSLIAEKSSKEHRSQAYGKRTSSIGIGQLSGILIGFLIFGLTKPTNNPYLYLISIPIFAISNFLAGPIFYIRIDESLKISGNIAQNEKLGEKNQSGKIPKAVLIGFSFLLLVFLLSSVNASIASPFFTIYLMENFNDDIFIALIAYLPAGLLGALLAPKIGKKVDKIRPEIGIALISIAGSILTWFLINTTDIWVFSVILFLDVVLGTTYGLIFQNLMSRITQKHRGKILGVSTFLTNIGMIIGPVLGGLVFDTNPALPFIISIFVEISLIPLYWVVVRSLVPQVEESYDSISPNSNKVN